MRLTLLALMTNIVFIQGRTAIGPSNPSQNYTHLDIYANTLSKAHYNAWTCNYGYEPGYRCISCTAALHCYPGNFALLVQCSGLLSYCRNGYCSLWKASGCSEDYMIAEGTHGPLRVTTVANDKTSISAEVNAPIKVTEVHDLPTKIEDKDKSNIEKKP